MRLNFCATIFMTLQLSMFLLCSANNGITPEQQKEAERITSTLFGTQSLAIQYTDKKNIENLIATLFSLNPYQMQRLAQHATTKFESLLQQTTQREATLHAAQQTIPTTLFYEKFLLQEIITHFKNYSSCTTHLVTPWDSMRCKIKNAYLKTAAQFLGWFGYKKSDPAIDAIVDQIVNYSTFERETIIYNYIKLLTFLRVKKDTPLPAIIDFWQSPELIETLKKRSKLINPEVKIQGIGMTAVMVIQAGIMFGGQISTQWLAGNDERFKTIQTQQDKITNDMKEFQAQLKQKQNAIMQNIETDFANSQTKIGDEYAQNNALLQQELIYLNRSINLDSPIARYLNNPLDWDKYFQTALMITPQEPPKTLPPWYNIFNNGDWQFDPTTNSFWQNSLIPFPKTLFWDKTDNKNIVTDDPASNSIFTEYITGQLSYDIEIECTIITCTYPFFAGVTFNRGRWISGDPERIWWYRALGLYGTEKTPGQPTTQAINLCYAQQQLVPKTKTETEKIISPLEQIIKNPASPINYQLPSSDVQSLLNNPGTYRFKITTTPGSITYTLEKKEAETTTLLTNGTINGLSSYIYTFHSLGFIAAGCQAEFKIIKPEALLFTSLQITSFQETLAKLLKT